MKTNFNFSHGRSLAVLATTLTAFAVVGCGGGGGSATLPPPVQVVTSATGSITAATSCTIADNASSCPAQVSFTTKDTTAPKLTVGATVVSTSASASNLAVTIGNGAFTVLLADGTTTLDTKSVSGACATGSTWDGNACKKPVVAFWPPKNITPMGVKVLSSNLNQLPAGCLSFTADCFKNFISDGKMVTLNTTAVMTGLPAPDDKRPLVTLAYRTPSGKPQITLFFADNGEAAVQDVIDLNTSNPFDWVMGNDRGYFKRNSDGTCLQWKWNYNTTTGKGLFWDYETTTCPQ